MLDNTTPDFAISCRVYFEDTDAGGVVYHANYLRYFERVRSDWLRHIGINQTLLLKEQCQFVVAQCQLDYLKPAFLGDELEITLTVSRVRRVSVQFQQQVWRHGELLCRGVVKVACIDVKTKRPVALPAAIVLEHRLNQ